MEQKEYLLPRLLWELNACGAFENLIYQIIGIALLILI